MIITITMHVNRDTELFVTSQTEERICWFAWTAWDNLLYSSNLSTSGTRDSCSHTVLCSHGQEATK